MPVSAAVLPKVADEDKKIVPVATDTEDHPKCFVYSTVRVTDRYSLFYPAGVFGVANRKSSKGRMPERHITGDL